MLRLKNISSTILTAMTVATMAGCGSGSGGGVGIVSVAVSDSALHEAVKVCINFDQIEFKGAGDSVVVDLDPAQTVNLLDFQGMNAAPILIDFELPAGAYQWMRLGVNALQGSNGGLGDTGGAECDGEASYLAMEDGTVYNLYVPSGAQSGLKLNGGFLVAAGGYADFTAEIDLMKSITDPVGLSPDVVLRPTIRLVNNLEVGALTGQINAELAGAEGCAPSVFVFDDGVMPNPINDAADPDPDDPVATALVEERMNAAEMVEYHYTVGFLLPGEYEVAFTCDNEAFEPEAGKPASIQAQVVTTVDF